MQLCLGKETTLLEAGPLASKLTMVLKEYTHLSHPLGTVLPIPSDRRAAARHPKRSFTWESQPIARTLLRTGRHNKP